MPEVQPDIVAYMRTQGVMVYAEFRGACLALDTDRALQLYWDAKARENEA